MTAWSTWTDTQTHLDVVLPQVGDDLCLIFIEDLEQNGPSLAVFLQQEQTAVPVLGGGGGTTVLRNRTLIWNTATHTHTRTHTQIISLQYKPDLQLCAAPFSLFTDTSLSWLLCVRSKEQRQHESVQQERAQMDTHTSGCAHACVRVIVCVCSARSASS